MARPCFYRQRCFHLHVLHIEVFASEIRSKVITHFVISTAATWIQQEKTQAAGK